MKERILNSGQVRGSNVGTYEYLVLSVNPGESVAEARQRVREHSEYGKWELERSRLYMGGGRRYWLRRRIIAVERTA